MVLTAPLDAARARLLRVAGRPGRLLLANRSARVAAYAAFGLVSTLLVACLAPLWAFALGPIVFGVPHLLADVRYLIVKPGLHRRRSLVVALALPAIAGGFVTNPAWGLLSGLAAIALARGVERGRRAVLLVAWGAVLFVAATHPRTAQLVLVHGHNLLAVALFAFGFARSRRLGLTALGVFAAVSVAMLGGAFDDVFFRWSLKAGGPASGLDLAAMVETLAPVADPRLALRLALFFVFAQGAHYAVWLRLVPDEARARPGLRSFASSLSALEQDLGKAALFVAVLLLGALALRASASLEAARVLYLRAAAFHGQIEIAFALLLALEGRAALGLPESA